MPRILVVEDSFSMRAFVRSTLEMDATLEGVEVVEAASGFDALRLLPRGRYDLVITDINMPDINGLELVSFLKNHPTYSQIPVMVVSTEGSAEDRRRAEALGAEDYLVKPFAPSDLIEKLKRLLESRPLSG